jgi:hypothetical protein
MTWAVEDRVNSKNSGFWYLFTLTLCMGRTCLRILLGLRKKGHAQLEKAANFNVSQLAWIVAHYAQVHSRYKMSEDDFFHILCLVNPF